MYAKDEAASQGFSKFYRMRQDPGWIELVRMIHIVQGLMAQEMFSSKFTELSQEEKDIKQRTFAGIREFLSFVENPSAELERAMYLQGHEKVINNLKQGRLKSVPAKKG